MQQADRHDGKDKRKEIHSADGGAAHLEGVLGKDRRERVELGADGGIQEILQGNRHTHGADHEIQRGRSAAA
jgi:hypothetical protein